MNNQFEMGQTINAKLQILSEKSVPLRVQPKKNLDLNDPLLKENQWMLEKHERISSFRKYHKNEAIYYKLKDQNENYFEFQSKKYLGMVGELVDIKNCRVKAKKILNDGKVVFILASGTQSQYENFRKWQK